MARHETLFILGFAVLILAWAVPFIDFIDNQKADALFTFSVILIVGGTICIQVKDYGCKCRLK